MRSTVQLSGLLIVLLLFLLTQCAPAQLERCPATAAPIIPAAAAGRAPSCIQLIAMADIAASGAAELHRLSSSPFTVSVDSAGHQMFQLDISLMNLPTPRSLGPYSTYVAWAATPDLAQEIKLGAVANGHNISGVVGLNRFIVMITAESSAQTAKHTGRVILNGLSPSYALQPHDALPITTGGDAMAHSHTGNAQSWVMPPRHPQVPTMVPGLDALVPAVRPWLPAHDVVSSRVPAVLPTQMIDLRDGDSISLTAGMIRRTIAGRSVVMYGFNGQSPGPVIRVSQKSSIVVTFTNNLDQPTSIHWHGVRLDNRFDGTPHVTQELVPVGASFRYVVHFPDAGIYWYHPHNREDTQQDLGLYGNLFVRPTQMGFFNPVDREEILMLDDFLVDSLGGAVPYGQEAATHALMGRFGNILLVNGAPDYALRVNNGDVVRFFLTNASSTRTFNVSLPGARVKLVGGDLGLIEREQWVASVVIAPAERYIVEARFDSAGVVPLINHVQGADRYRGQFFDEVDTLGLIAASPALQSPSARPATDTIRGRFEALRTNTSIARDIDRVRPRFASPPDYTLQLTLDTAQTLPSELWQTLNREVWYGNPVEWTATMPMMDWLSTSRDVHWVLRDSATGRENMNIAWTFRAGDIVRLRLVNDARILHPMQHPIHIHGQRFLVIAVDGRPMTNLLWKDTALVPAGSTVDLLVEMTNPGKWMLHCHIAEHLESGMHMVFDVIK